MIYIGILPAFIALEVIRRFLSSQGIAKPLLYIPAIWYCIWHPFSLYIVFSVLETKDFIYAPLCNVLTTYLNVVSIIFYCIIKKPHNPLSLKRMPISMIFKWETNSKYDTFIIARIK